MIMNNQSAPLMRNRLFGSVMISKEKVASLMLWCVVMINFLRLCTPDARADQKNFKDAPKPSSSDKVRWSSGMVMPLFSIEDLRTETPLTDSQQKENLIVLIHGWNPDGHRDSLNATWEWQALSCALTIRLNQFDSAKSWALVHCDWSTFASTGSRIDPRAPAQAAINARFLGSEYARQLHWCCPNLRRVQFIAHSAGSWLAKTAIKGLLERNPLVLCELTLLDPFIPEIEGLTIASMRSLSELPISDQASRVWQLSNLWSWDLVSALGTTNVPDFDWSSNIKTIQRQIDGNGGGAPYGGHSGPIHFYGDTVFAAIGHTPSGLSTVDNWENYGAQQSILGMAPSFPSFSSFTPSSGKLSRPTGQSAYLEAVSHSSTARYQWYRLQRPSGGAPGTKTRIPGATQQRYNLVVSAATEGDYVCELTKSDAERFKTYSQVFSVKVAAAVPALPVQITGITPPSLSAETAGTQALSLTGDGFTSGMTLRFRDPSGTETAISPTVDSPSSATTTLSVFNKPGTWRIFSNAGNELFRFPVTSTQSSPVTPTLSRVVISGVPTTLVEGSTGSAQVYAHLSDGTRTLVQPTSFESSSPAIASPSISGTTTLINTSSVSADTTVTLTARYSQGGIQRSGTHTFTLLDNPTVGGGSGADIVRNGIFASPGLPWVTAGSFQITSDFAFGGHTGGYAWMALPGGGRGNGLVGSIQQRINLPSNASSLTLRFSVAVSLDSPGAATSGDYLEVTLRDTNQLNPVRLRTITPVSDPAALGAWKTIDVDITAYKGQTKELIFGALTDGSNAATWRVDDVSVISVASGPSLLGLAIEGPSVVSEKTSTPYTARAYLSDGTSTSVTGSASWSVSANGSFSGGQFQAAEVIGERQATLTATYAANGIMRTATKDITVLNVAPVPVSLTVTGPVQMDENTAVPFFAVVQYSTGARYDVTATAFWSSQASLASPVSGGYFRAYETASDQPVAIRASYTAEGVEVVGDFVVMVKDRLPPPIPVSLAVHGPNSVDEGQMATFDAEVTFNDGTKAPAAVTWTEDSRFTTVSPTGLLFTFDVLSDQSVTLGASYSRNGSTVNATKSVGIRNIRNVQARPEIVMPAAMDIALDRPVNIAIQTSEPASTATAIGLPPGLVLDPALLAVTGSASTEGRFEATITATNDFGTSQGIIIFTVSGDSGPEWIRVKSAQELAFGATMLSGDGNGGCYYASSSQLARRSASGTVEWQRSLPFTVKDISASPSGLLVAAESTQTAVIDGITIARSPSGQKDAVLLKFSASGVLAWANRCHTSGNIVNSSSCTLTPEGLANWTLGIFGDALLFSTDGVHSLDMTDRSGISALDTAAIMFDANGRRTASYVWGGAGGSQQIPLFLGSYGATPVVGIYGEDRQMYRKQGGFPFTANLGSYTSIVDYTGWPLGFRNPSGMVGPTSGHYVNVGAIVTGTHRGQVTVDEIDSLTGSARVTHPAFDSTETSFGFSSFVLKIGARMGVEVITAKNPPEVIDAKAAVHDSAAFSTGETLVAGEFRRNIRARGVEFLGSSTDATVVPNDRIFVGYCDSDPKLIWAVSHGSPNGDLFRGFVPSGPDRWFLLGQYGAQARFGGIPVFPSGGTILTEYERKQAVVTTESFENWRARSLSAGMFNALRASPTVTDADGNGAHDLLDYASGAEFMGAPRPSYSPAVQTAGDGQRYLTVTFTRSLARPDAKIAVEVSACMQNWVTGSVYVPGGDVTDTPNTIEQARTTNGLTETITVRAKRPVQAGNHRMMRLKVTTGATPVPSPALQ